MKASDDESAHKLIINHGTDLFRPFASSIKNLQTFEDIMSGTESKEEFKPSGSNWYLTEEKPCNVYDDEESDTYGASDLVCRLCCKLVVDAVTTYCCGTLYCRHCITRALDVETKCPHCHQVLDFGGLQPDIRAEKRSLAHVRRCDYFRDGCRFRGNREEVDTHMHTMCEYAPEVEEEIMHNELVTQSHHAWDSGNQFLPAFKKLHFPRRRGVAVLVDEDATPAPRLVPSTIRFFPYNISDGVSWKFSWLVDYQWKLHALIRCHDGQVSLMFYKDLDTPSSIVACIRLISPHGPEHSLLFSTNSSIHKWAPEILSPADASVVSVWDFGTIMTVHQFHQFIKHGKFAVAAIVEH